MTPKKEIPQDEEDMEIKDPISKEKMTIEGEHFSVAKDLDRKEKEPLTDGDGNVLSDRIIAELLKNYGPFPDTLNDQTKGEYKTWDDEKSGLTCELQVYGEGDRIQEIRRSYETKRYGAAIKKLREALEKGSL